MQLPTCTDVRIRSTADAHIIFHAVAEKKLQMITRRLDTEERQELRSGNCYVWEERGSDSEATGMGIERWTDGQSWGPSRVREDFLFYAQRESHSGADIEDPMKPAKVRGSLKYGKRPRSQAPPGRSSSTTSGTGVQSTPGRLSQLDQLVKQTYSVFTKLPEDPESKPARKWHLTAYFTQRTVEDLRTVAHIPELAGIVPPPDRYRSAKVGKKRDPSDSVPMPGTSVLFRPDHDHLPSPTVPTLEPSNPSGIYQAPPSMSPGSYSSGVAWPSGSGLISAPPSAGPSRHSHSPTSYFPPHYPPESSTGPFSTAPLPTHHRDHSRASLHGTFSKSPRIRILSMPSRPHSPVLRRAIDQKSYSPRPPLTMPVTPPDEHMALPTLLNDNQDNGRRASSPGLVTMSDRALPPLQFIKPDRFPARNPVDESALWALTGRFNR